MRVLLEGAWYGPYASEGRWAWNIARLLDSMVARKLIDSLDLILIPNTHLARDYNIQEFFPNSNLIEKPIGKYDTFFLVQPGGSGNKIDINDSVEATRRIICIFELYWSGEWAGNCENVPEGSKFCYAIHPYHPAHQSWPTKFPYYQLPFAAHYLPDSKNFDNKGIFLTIKFVLHNDNRKELQLARIEHFKIALEFKKQGIPITIGHLLPDEKFTDANPILASQLLEIINELKYLGTKSEYKVIPTRMENLIKNHSIILPGKVGEINLYGSFYDSISWGSIPVIWSDWPEQFFKENIFPEYDIDKLRYKTNKLLTDRDYYLQELNLLRSNINLFTREQGIKRILELIYE